MRLQLKVTEQDIRLGSQNSCDKCAVARAVSRTMKVPSRNLEVTGDEIGIFDDAYYQRYSFVPSNRMATFIERFDKDKTKVKPTTFTIYGKKLF